MTCVYAYYAPSCAQVVFVERVELLSVTTKTKTLEVKGGFYSKEDMKTELGYNECAVLINKQIDCSSFVSAYFNQGNVIVTN